MKLIPIAKIVESVPGKFFTVLLALTIFNLQSCTYYYAASTNTEELKKEDQVVLNLDYYKFYIHENNQTFELQHPKFEDDGSISGILVHTNYVAPDSSWSKSQLKEYWENHLYDINIYCQTTDFTADKNSGAVVTKSLSSQLNGQVFITAEMIEQITITSIDKEKKIVAIAVVLLVTLGVIVATFLIVLLTAIIATASSDGANASSDESSGNSGSGGSSSDSGTSNSNSGGSGSSG